MKVSLESLFELWNSLDGSTLSQLAPPMIADNTAEIYDCGEHVVDT